MDRLLLATRTDSSLRVPAAVWYHYMLRPCQREGLAMPDKEDVDDVWTRDGAVDPRYAACLQRV